MSDKLSLKTRKTFNFLFHKNSKMDNLPLLLPKFQICNKNIMRKNSSKLLSVILEERVNWKDPIRII